MNLPYNVNYNDVGFNNFPWSNMYQYINLDFLSVYNAKNAETCIPVLRHFIDNIYQSCCVLFVDGSVTADGRVGAAVYSPSVALDLKFRLPNGTSVYYSESYAILQALDYIKLHQLNKSFIISDACTVLNDIKFADLNRSPHPSILSQISNL